MSIVSGESVKNECSAVLERFIKICKKFNHFINLICKSHLQILKSGIILFHKSHPTHIKEKKTWKTRH